jgi:L-2,4-diaminobutyric acid acetyltransferase
MQSAEITYRPPAPEDAPAIWRLVRDSGVLDVNSVYCYLLLCKDFADTCAVAERQGAIVGFVTAYIPPGRGDTLFIWQIGVASELRGRGLAGRLLQALLRRAVCRGIRFVEATVGPTNRASRALFTALARDLDAALDEQSCFDASVFAEGDHEPENLLRIGPFSLSQSVLV